MRRATGTSDARLRPVTDSTAEGQAIRRLIGVYNAEGTLRGELTYWVGKRLGRVHCALCDITHGSVRERSDWQHCRDGLPVPFDAYHRDDQPAAVRSATGDNAPAVLAETSEGVVVLLGADELELCGKSPQRLVDALTIAAADHHLDWE